MKNDELYYQDDTNQGFPLTASGGLSGGTMTGNLILTGKFDPAGEIDPTSYGTGNGGFIDDDTFASASDTAVASQQSIKVWVRAEDEDVHASAYGEISAAAAVSDGNHNIASANKTATGVYEVTFTTALSSTNYSVTATMKDNFGFITAASTSAALCTVETKDTDGNDADRSFNITVFAND